MPNLIDWLIGTDYFVAPASTKYHGAEPGGLAKHSLNVYELFKHKNEFYKMGLPEETVIICSLLHDACKIETYVRVEAEKKYKVEDMLPLGHGEKSVMMLQKFIPLSAKEMMIIRWHMLAFDAGIHFWYPTGASFNKARDFCPELIAFSCADLEASFIIEKRGVGNGR
jgi:hypothetical protein